MEFCMQDNTFCSHLWKVLERNPNLFKKYSLYVDI